MPELWGQAVVGLLTLASHLPPKEQISKPAFAKNKKDSRLKTPYPPNLVKRVLAGEPRVLQPNSERIWARSAALLEQLPGKGHIPCSFLLQGKEISRDQRSCLSHLVRDVLV